MYNSVRTIFLVGSGHCGSTLLDLLLDSHSKVTALGEPQEYDYGKCPPAWGACSTCITTPVELYQSKLSILFGRSEYFFSKTRKHADIELYQAWNRKFLDCIYHTSGAEVVVDSSKNVERVRVLTEAKDICPLVIHLIRDGRGVTWSYLRKYPHKPFFALTVWFFSNLKIEFMKRRTNSPVLVMRYENLVQNPERELTRILGMVGLTFENDMLNFHTKSHAYHLGGNRMKHAAGGAIRLDEVWRDSMPLGYKLLFNILFGWLNWYYRVRY